ncbi:hypothetical protein RCL1_001867 [Eukaryota sp. TZLM3-RCL]
MNPTSLPIHAHKSEFLKLFHENQALVLVGETGCGKSTQIPQFLPKKLNVFITQPRRVAAITLAKRVSSEMRSPLGREVGYHVRFDDCTTPNTRIKFFTDGMLLREMMIDPLLSKCNVIIIDEAHERSLSSEVLLGLTKQLLQKRPDLKAIIMSATLQAEAFAEFLSCPIMSVMGRMYPVETFYTPTPEPDYIIGTIIAVTQIHLDEEDGDILCFLPGQDDIEAVIVTLKQKNELIKKHNEKLGEGEVAVKEMLICPLFAALPQEEQLQVFSNTPNNVRKIIVATNIAETSLTIPGIKYVVDCGLRKQRVFHPQSGVEVLRVEPASKAALTQRKGRAGRQSSGKCFRLFTEDVVEELPDTDVPEILRSDLANSLLSLLVMDINLFELDMLDRPTPESLNSALSTLIAMGAVKKTVELDASMKLECLPLGKTMSLFPVSVHLSRSLVFAAERGVHVEVATIIALLSSEHLFFESNTKRGNNSIQRFIDISGDHLMLLKLYREFSEFAKLKTKENNGNKELYTQKSERRAMEFCKRCNISWKSLRHALDVRKQLIDYCSNAGFVLAPHTYSNEQESIEIRKSLVAGSFLKVASFRPEHQCYRTLSKNQDCFIHPSSVLALHSVSKPQYVLFSELVFTSKLYMRNVSEISIEWLGEVVPQFNATLNL